MQKYKAYLKQTSGQVCIDIASFVIQHQTVKKCCWFVWHLLLFWPISFQLGYTDTGKKVNVS